MYHNEQRLNIYASLLAIVAGMLFGLLIMLITNPMDAIPGFYTILTGGFSKGINELLYYASPIILTGLSVGFAFKTGLFNIGASGQLMVGAIAAIYVGVNWTFLPGFLHCLVALLTALIFGALWGLIPGILKAYLHVNEVVGTIMMNYIGLYFVNYLVLNVVWNEQNAESQSVATNAAIPWNLFGIPFYTGFIVALLAVMVIYILLDKTTFGYQLKAVGLNRDASRYAGINEKRNIIYALAIAGALSGLAGGIIYLAGGSGRHLEPVEVLAAEGFTGISVALIGLSHPLGILFSGLFMGYLQISGWNLQLYDYPKEIIDIIISSIIYFSALVLLFKGLINRTRKRGNENG